MIYTIIFIAFYFFSKNRFSISSILALLIAFSGFCAVLIDKDLDYVNLEDFVYAVFTSVLLIILINSLKNISIDVNQILNIKLNKKFILFIHIVCSIALLFSIYILFSSLSSFKSNHNTIEQFKNEGEADVVIKSTIGTISVSFVRLISPLSYLILPFHFIYIVKKQYLNSIFFFLYSTILPIVGLFALSRSFLTQYIFIYFFLFLLFQPFISRKVKKLYLIVSLSVAGLILFINFSIAKERFSDSYYYENRISKESMIKDKSMYSLFDYYSQWISNNNETLKNYDIDKNLFGKGSLPLLRRFDIIDAKEFSKERSNALKAYSTSFNGLISALVYDFGFVITVVFVLLISSFIRNKMKPNKIHLTTKLMTLSLFLAFIGMFFVGNVLYYEIYSISIIFLIFIHKTKIAYI